MPNALHNPLRAIASHSHYLQAVICPDVALREVAALANRDDFVHPVGLQVEGR